MACYILYPVPGNNQGVIYTKDWANALPDYVNTIASLSTSDNSYACFYIAESDECPANSPHYTDYRPVVCDNTTMCYTIGGTGTVTYVDTDLVVQTAFAPVQVCSRIIPVVSGNDYAIVEENSCLEAGCGDFCFKLTNCDTGEEIITDNQNIITPYAFAQTVKLDGYEGCWTISKSDTCDCAVNVTVTKTFADCISCLPTIAYKFVNCSNAKQVKYTLQDFHDLVGKTVSLDCGDCWTVELINYQPPSTSVITVINVYDNCVQCTRPYWLLMDCSEVLPPVITYTDMTNYVHKYIKLVNDNTCWYVDTTTSYVGATTVSVTAEYETCDLCSADATCICTKVTNTSDVAKTYTYVDCDNITQTFTLAAGAVSDKTCIKKWTVRYPTSDVIETFGNCYEDPQTQIMTCPAIPTGRVVAPGYYVPTCSIEKYEQTVCNSSEALYKQVLQERYGISNCCPEDDQKWFIQKELVSIDSLLDKNYTCALSTCCGTASCGCSSCIN